MIRELCWEARVVRQSSVGHDLLTHVLCVVVDDLTMTGFLWYLEDVKRER